MFSNKLKNNNHILNLATALKVLSLCSLKVHSEMHIRVRLDQFSSRNTKHGKDMCKDIN